MPQSKWQYASLPAETRLEMIGGGNKQVYDEELERTKSVIEDRQQLGLDISEQKAWADRIGYAYHLNSASQVGISPERVLSGGYADQLLGQRTLSLPVPLGTAGPETAYAVSDLLPYFAQQGDTKNLYEALSHMMSVSLNAQKSDLNQRYANYEKLIKQQYETAKDAAVKKLEDFIPLLRESIVNSGGSLEGGTAKTEELKMRENLKSLIEAYDSQMFADLSNAKQTLAGQLSALDTSFNDNLQAQFWNYINLAQNADALNYARERDLVSDQKWENEFLFNTERAEKDQEFRQRQSDQSYEQWLESFLYGKQKDSEESIRWLAEMAAMWSKQAASEAQWQFEFDADNRYRAMEAENKKNQLRLEKEKLDSSNARWQSEFDAGVESQKISASQEIFSSIDEIYSYVKWMYGQLITDPSGKKVKKYSSSDIIEFLKNLNITEKQRKEIAASIDVTYP